MPTHLFASFGTAAHRQARTGIVSGVAFIEFAEEDAEYGEVWVQCVRDSGIYEGRRRMVEEMRSRGEVPPARRGGKRFSGRCSYCLKQSDDLERDHIVPFSQGGGEEPDNLTPVCRTCNSKKKDMSLLQFVARGVS